MIRGIDKGDNMESIRKLEATVAEWYKNAPHLPKEVQKWIATNAWWIVLVGVVAGVFATLTVLSVTFFAGAILAGVGGAVGAAIGGLAIVAVLIGLFLSVVQLVLAAMAIQPLKALKKKGWDLLFIITLLDVVSLAVLLLLTFDIFGTIWGLLWVAVGAFFLFEIREYYAQGARSDKKVVEAKTVPKTTSK